MVSVFMYLLFSVFAEYLKFLSIRRHRDVKSLTVSTFSSVRALRGLPLPGRLSTVPVSRNFVNSLLTLRFVLLFSGNSSVNLFAVYPFKYKLFIKFFSSSLNTILIVDKTAVTSAVTYFRCHKLIVKVSK